MILPGTDFCDRPVKAIGGMASVPAVPTSVAHVVPGGTFRLLMAEPTAIPVALATDAARDPAVVVRVVMTAPQMAMFIGPRIANGALGLMRSKVPLTTALA